ncbi:hypothetical protein GJ698_06510 [Pseudoduganella sp. FT26W]|uniref:Uncharacterized protein n=1 Tax=Duganella aquatilis TaxID=2666082 RepID=A0A844D1U0_9BURK|nr:hypothetical protein [Duganella aquatilis]MRW83745.1 hypothetical protein [Duganella aquatilis]
MKLFDQLPRPSWPRKETFLKLSRFLNSCIMLMATALAAYASWYSYKAAEKANATASDAYLFTVRAANDASTLQQPSLSVMAGKITQGKTEGDGYFKEVWYRAELRIRNSGARDAAPAWVSLSDGVSGTWSAIVKLGNIPKDQEIVVSFDLKGEERLALLKKLEVLAVGLRYLDTAPEYKYEHQGANAVSFKRSCGTPRIQLLTRHRTLSESGENEVDLTMGPAFAPEQLTDTAGWNSGLGAAREAYQSLIALSSKECQSAEEK